MTTQDGTAMGAPVSFHGRPITKGELMALEELQIRTANSGEDQDDHLTFETPAYEASSGDAARRPLLNRKG